MCKEVPVTCKELFLLLRLPLLLQHCQHLDSFKSRMMYSMSEELERLVKSAVVTRLKCSPGIYLEGLRKLWKTLVDGIASRVLLLYH
jgi:hypothetical protein